ncbi:protease Lon-related BREX system protein BrxL [Patescibacteria group bacterium]|nr:protease Lon-related BREX system protein BrxL [Patescibacteria group bacterium]
MAMMEERKNQTGWVDALDQKLFDAFPGRVVRKDLVKRFKVGDNIPVYVLEYLLGKYCSTTNAKEIEEGILRVKDVVTERIVRADRGELIKSNLRKNGLHKLIDLVTVIFDEKDEGGKYWAHLAAAGLDHVHIKEDLVYEHERILTGGIWANLEITYDETLVHKGVTRPFVLNRLQPIQIASANLQEFLEGRARFTRDEWIDVLLRTMGYEPTNGDFTPRRKLLFLTRMIPMVEKNYNLIELGPRGTGKSYVYREISPYVILLSGGQGSVADLFGWKNRQDKPGLVVRYDLVAFDEVAGPNFKKENDKQMYKGYMEQRSFSRGDDKGTIQADAGIVFNGNIDGDVESIARVSHLFSALPDSIRNDMAFHDRWHAYLPGWEIPKMQTAYFTDHLGFISDYIAEIFHEGLRNRNFADAHDRYFSFGNHLEARDRTAVVKTVSGLVKLLHPANDPTRPEMEEYVRLALEMRRRVKEQLKRMGGIEYAKVNFSYIDKETGEESFVGCPELGNIQLIPDTPLPPGDIFTIGYDPAEARYSLYRIQINISSGSGKFTLVGTSSKNIREAAKMAYDFLKTNGRKMGIDRDLSSYDANVQVISLMQGKDAHDVGVAFFVGLVSALLSRTIAGGLVVLGEMSIHGVLSHVEGLGDKLRVAMDSGARRVMIPTVNRKDFATLPDEVIDKMQIEFYSDPAQAAFKALAEG